MIVITGASDELPPLVEVKEVIIERNKPAVMK